MFQRVVGVRVGGDDPLDSGGFDGIRVVVAQGHEKRLFAEAPDFMAAVFFRRAQDSEILSDMVENLRRCPPDRLHPVVVGGNAVDEIQGVGAVLLVEDLDVAGLLELLRVCPVGFLLLHLAVGIAAALERLQWLLQGLGHISVIDHAPPQIDDLVDVLDQQRAFFLASAAGGAGPDFIFGINAADLAADQCLPLFALPKNRIVLEAVISAP